LPDLATLSSNSHLSIFRKRSHCSGEPPGCGFGVFVRTMLADVGQGAMRPGGAGRAGLWRWR
jgi:hypothetical protein